MVNKALLDLTKTRYRFLIHNGQIRTWPMPMATAKCRLHAMMMDACDETIMRLTPNSLTPTPGLCPYGVYL